MITNGKLLRSAGAFLCLAAATAFGQERFGELNGTVTDPSGAVLPNVAVRATNKGSGRVVETVSGAAGHWVLRNIEPGHYAVRFEARGFTTYEVGDVNLTVGKALTVNAPMTIARSEQTVQVTEAAPLIDTTNTVVAHNITAEEFDRLPKARSFQGLAVLSTSVNTGDIEGGIQVNGASGAENNFIVDGISTNSLINGQSRQNAFFEVLQEVQVKTGGISAEYGGALGGVVSAITKSGGNAFHGDVHYYLSGNKLSAAPRKRLLLSPTDDTTTRYWQDAKQKSDGHELGYSLGGYLIKNRVYFFSAAMPNWTRNTFNYKFSNGRDDDTIAQKRLTHMAYEKLSMDVTKNLRASFTFLWTPTMSTGVLPGYNGEGPNFAVASRTSQQIRKNQGFFQPQTNYGGQIDWVASPTTLISIKGGRYWDNYKDLGLPEITPVTYSTPGTNLPFTIPSALVGGTGFTNTPRVQRTTYDIATRTYIQADMSKLINFMGTHDFKAGVGTQKIVNRVLTEYPTGGYINIFWDRAFSSSVPGGPRNARGQYGYYEYHEIGTSGTTGANLGNFYFQDNWRVIPRLTLNIGFRFESETVPSFQRNVQDTAFHFGWGTKFAPRLGAAYDMFGDGRIKLFGSWGRYYDWVKYELARGTFGGDYWRVRYRTLDTTDVFSLNSRNIPGQDLWNPAVPGSFRNRRVPGFDEIDPDIKPMGSTLMNYGVEAQIAPQMVFRAAYVRNSLIRTIEDLGVLVDGDEHYFYANPGSGIASITPTSGASKPFPTPKAVRNYDAVELQLSKRYGSWFGSASYTISRLYGNYAGLASSDEIRTGADGGGVFGPAQQSGGQVFRQGGNANRAWDIDELLWDSKGTLDPRGRLATDRPLVMKFHGSKTFAWGSEKKHVTDIGGFWYGGYGTPLTTMVNTLNGTQTFVNGRGDLGRTPFLSQVDMVFGHDVKMGESKRLRFEFNALNFFNQKTARSVWTQLNRARASAEPNLASVDLARGYDYRALIGRTSEGAKAFSPLFGQQDWFNPGFAGRFLVKFIF